MILELIEYLRTLGFRLPAVFGYTSTRAMLAALTAFVITIACGSRFIRFLYAVKIGQPIRQIQGGFLLHELHKNKKDTPTMGGLLLLFALFLAQLLWMDLTHPFTWLLAITMLSLGAVGGYDDYLKLRYKNADGISAKKKLLFQLLVALLVTSYLQIPCVSEWLQSYCGLKIPLIKEHFFGL